MSIHKSTDNPRRKVAGERFSRSKRETITNDISESEKLREAYRRERSFKATHFNRDIRKEFTEAAYCEQTFLAQPHFSRPSSFPPRAHTRLIAQLLPSRYLRLLARCSLLSLCFLDIFPLPSPSFAVLASFSLCRSMFSYTNHLFVLSVR